MNQSVIDDASARRLRQRLHDGLGQSLSLAAMQIDQVMVASCADTMRRARLLLRDALDEVRALIDSIGHAVDEPAQDLPGRMLACVRSLNARQPIPVNCTVEGAPTVMPAQACEILFLAAQELLVSACKHASADCVEMRLSFLPYRLSITVTEHFHSAGTDLTSRVIAPGFGLGLGLGLWSMHRGLDQIGARLRWRKSGPRGVLARISWMQR